MCITMNLTFVLLILIVEIAAAGPARNSPKVVGGLLTTIEEYPFLVAVLRLETAEIYLQACSGAILNSRTVLSAAHCYRDPSEIFRIRVGSSFANSDGEVYNIENYIIHPEFNWILLDNDISILRTSTRIVYKEGVQQGAIAGEYYNVNDNSIVWIAGWGRWQGQSAHPVQLRHDSQRLMNHKACKEHYANLIGLEITDNMICGSWYDTPIQRFCTDDSGGPLFHYNEKHKRYVIIGVTAFNNECGRLRYPGVSTRVSGYISWIQDHTQ